MVTTNLARPTSLAPGRHAEPERLTVGVWLIVILKGITALLLWAAVILLIIAHQTNPQSFFAQLIRNVFRGDEPELAIRFIAMNTLFISKTMLLRVALATGLYALVESVEAAGLFLRKRWAEWLVIAVTVSFIPFELFELVMKPNAWKPATLIINVIILVYLLQKVLAKRRAGAA